MARVLAIKVPRWHGISSAAQGVDYQKQRHLIQPGVQRLPGQFWRRALVDIDGILAVQLAENFGTAIVKEASVKIEIAAPICNGARVIQ